MPKVFVVFGARFAFVAFTCLFLAFRFVHFVLLFVVIRHRNSTHSASASSIACGALLAFARCCLCVCVCVLGVLGSHDIFLLLFVFFVVAAKYFRYKLNFGLNSHATHAAAFVCKCVYACVSKSALAYVSVKAKCKFS